MFGSHLSIAGGMTNALDKAADLGLDCVQVFTKNQRQWRVRPLDPGAVRAWHARLRELGWHRRNGPVRVVSHNSYLVNMASPDPELWQKSVELQRIEIERCEALNIRLCVAHPGAHIGTARPRDDCNRLDGEMTADEMAGLGRIVDALDAIHRDLAGYRTLTCLETTVGSGTNLGYDFHHLAWIRERAAEPGRIGFCFDTCHVTAAGYDLTTEKKARAVLRHWDTVCGRRNLRVFHLNDSQGAVGSRRDRHAHIGDGACGRACFRTILNRPGAARVPKILETPKGCDEEGVEEWDLINVRRLKRLGRRPVASR